MATVIKKGKIPNKTVKILKKNTNNKVKKEFILEGLGCANCAAKMEDKISKLKGVTNVSVNFMTKSLALEIEEINKTEELIAATQKIVTNIESHVVVKEKVLNKGYRKVLLLEGLDCANCASKIERKTNNIIGVQNAIMDFVSKKLFIEINNKTDESRIVEEISKIIKIIEPDVQVVEEGLKEEKSHNNEHEHNHEEQSNKKQLIQLSIGAGIFVIASIFKFNFWPEFILYLVSYLLVGGEVVLRALKNISKGQVFDENFLMSIATIGAFSIKQFPEGVAVMLFYQVGELFQDIAVNRSRKSISSLMDIRPDFANVKLGDEIKKVTPEEVKIGDFIIVKPGEKIPLDGTIVEGKSMLDTSALTGESVPRNAAVGDDILGGFINKNGVLTIKVTKEFGESTVAKILDLVENASSKKAPTENFITKFARYYTPIVVISAALLAFIPPLLISGASFSNWIYRALVFLVVSCPCALVVSIPLGFFGGIGGASKNGILVKGGNYLEALNNVEMVIFDKTGTLTKGVFKVTEINALNNMSKEEILEYAAFAESYSNHPIATSILNAYKKEINKNIMENYEEISGHGVRVVVEGKEVLCGNVKLMDREKIFYSKVDTFGTVVHVAIDKKYLGYIVISDEIKKDSEKAIQGLKRAGVKKTIMLTGDNKAVGLKVGQELGLDEVYSELLPHEKVEKLEMIDKQKSLKGKVIFVGDGINDAPVLARADIGIAMGGVGSDAAIEAADVVIMTDEPSKIVTAIKIAKRTKSIVMQNIVFALGVKILILILGALGIANMWEAVFGDVGVAVIAILNSMRALKVKKSF
jgi:Cd2+/Zn2+-exporting ATPase